MPCLRNWIIALLFISVGTGSWSACFAQNFSAEQEYQRLSGEFRQILALQRPDEQQVALEKLIEKLRLHIQKDSEQKTLDRAYYLTAQCHHRIHDINRSEKHLNLALENYRRVTSKYPKSPLADDAQYLIGILHLHSDPSQAYLELRKVELFYPSGDMRSKARQKLAQLEQRLPHLAGGAQQAAESPKKGKTASKTRENKPSKRQESPPPQLTRITDIKHWSGEEYTRVAIYTDAPVSYREEIVPGNRGRKRDPKIHIDLEGCAVSSTMKKEILVMDGFLQDVRTQQISQSTTRITLDAQAIDRYRIFSMSDPFRIIVDVRGETTPPKKTTRRPLPEPPKAPVPSLAAQLALDVTRIVIDPGHGGKDKGAISPKGTYEKDIVLSIAKKLKTILERETGVQVILTRSDDRFLSLEERTAIANAQKADLFISIHTNAHENRELYGTETYFLNFSKDQESARVAAMENATSRKKISDLENILHGLMLNTKLDESSRLAQSVQKNMIEELTSGYEEVKDLGIKQAPFYVLLGAEMPSILIEAGFITHEREEKRLKDHKFQEDLALAITRGVQSYIREMRGFASAGASS